jgi:branched-chain amino acid transport system ATP-binding protein
VQNVSFSIEAGIVYAVIGPNGAGKTTLFNLITGVYTPTSGEIKLDGESIGGKSPVPTACPMARSSALRSPARWP